MDSGRSQDCESEPLIGFRAMKADAEEVWADLHEREESLLPATLNIFLFLCYGEFGSGRVSMGLGSVAWEEREDDEAKMREKFATASRS